MSNTAGIRILLVDDEPDLAELTADMLERENGQFTVETAAGTSEGLERLADHGVDCIVSDHDMPGRNGIEFLEAVREEYPDLPFILFTGKGSEEVASDAISAGVTDYLQKEAGSDQYALLANRIENAVERMQAQQLRRRSDRRFEAVFEDPQMLVGILDPDGTLRDANQTAIEYIDADHDAVIGEPFWTTPWWSDKTRSDVREWVERAADGEYVEYEATHTMPEGNQRSITGTIRPVTNDTGEVVSLIASARDVTDREKHEQDLQNERAFIDQALDTLHDVVYVVGTDGTLRRWNDRFSDVTGYSDDEIATMEAVGFFPEDEQDRIAEAIEETLTSGQVTIEADFLTADGERIPYEFTGDRLTDSDGELIGLVGVGRNVSERIERESALEQLHPATRDLIAATTTEEVARLGSETATQVLNLPMNGIHRYDPDEEELVPIAWSDESETIFDGPPPAIPVADSLAGQAYRSGETKIYADVREADAPFNPETDMRSELHVPIGEYGVLVAGSTVPGDFDTTDEALARVLATNVESAIDRVEREQKLQRQNERLDEFVSVVSHDLRNPLNVATGRLELAQQECDTDYLDDVARAHDRIETLIEDLLTLARQGEHIDETDPVDLAAIATESWRTVETTDATLVTETSRTIQAVPGRLKQLLANLFRNAVEHGGESVTVIVGDLDDGFYIADDGPGIPAEKRDQVFDAGYSTAEVGTGFGLSIVKQVADAHNWNVRVTDSSEGGARFEITGVEYDE